MGIFKTKLFHYQVDNSQHTTFSVFLKEPFDIQFKQMIANSVSQETTCNKTVTKKKGVDNTSQTEL